MKKKIVLVFAVLLTSAVVLSLILAITRYVGFLKAPDEWGQRFSYQVLPDEQQHEGVTVQVRYVGANDTSLSTLLTGTFWVFELTVDNVGDQLVDVDFGRARLELGGREVRCLSQAEALRLLQERTTGAMASGAGRRGYSAALDQLEERQLGLARVFPGYARTSLVFFQPHPEAPEELSMRFEGIRNVDGDEMEPLTFSVVQRATVEAGL